MTRDLNSGCDNRPGTPNPRPELNETKRLRESEKFSSFLIKPRWMTQRQNRIYAFILFHIMFCRKLKKKNPYLHNRVKVLSGSGHCAGVGRRAHGHHSDVMMGVLG